jgi:glyoxylase-like metal-dependent hydrolase (beta-lactamase superfamily II)
MNVERIVVGQMGTNCYIVGNDQIAAIVDPGDDADVIKQHIRSREVKYILLTHTHVDHIGALNEIAKAYPDAKVAVHKAEKDFLKSPQKNLSAFMGLNLTFQGEVDIELEDGMTLPFGDSEIKVIHTSGHTPGGVCFLIGKNLITGDALFRMSIGRTDFPGGSYGELIENIREKIFTLPEDIRIFPGHMEESSVGFEKKNNPFLN